MWLVMVRFRLMVLHAKYDIFRIENGEIVEHWDNKEVMPKVEYLTNRGKF